MNLEQEILSDNNYDENSYKSERNNDYSDNRSYSPPRKKIIRMSKEDLQAFYDQFCDQQLSDVDIDFDDLKEEVKDLNKHIKYPYKSFLKSEKTKRIPYLPTWLYKRIIYQLRKIAGTDDVLLATDQLDFIRLSVYNRILEC